MYVYVCITREFTKLNFPYRLCYPLLSSRGSTTKYVLLYEMCVKSGSLGPFLPCFFSDSTLSFCWSQIPQICAPRLTFCSPEFYRDLFTHIRRTNNFIPKHVSVRKDAILPLLFEVASLSTGQGFLCLTLPATVKALTNELSWIACPVPWVSHRIPLKPSVA